MALPVPPNYNTPIPNNPFYSVPTYIVKSAYSPFVVGTGLYVSPQGTISAIGGGGGGAVSGIFPGTGIGVSSNTGNVTISNTGVTSIVAGTGIGLSANTGAITITNTCSGTVTAINTGTGLTGGPITTSGTIALANTAVSPGTYVNPTLTVDAQGRITNATAGTALGSLSVTAPITSTGGVNPTIGITAASTTACGAVQLSDSVTSTSSATAATSLALKTSYDIAIQAVPKSCFTNPGDLLTATAASTVYTLPIGTNGQVLTVDTAVTGKMKWANPGSGVTPNYGSFLSTATQTVGTLNVGQPVTLTTVATNNFTLIGGSQVTATVAGTYNIQISLQIISTGGGGGDVEVWFVKNGTAIGNSNTRYSVKNANEEEVAALNLVDTFAAGDNIQVYWASNNSLMTLATLTSSMGGPAIPSAIVTIVPVGA